MLGWLLLLTVAAVVYLISQALPSAEPFDSEPSLPPFDLSYQQRINEIIDVNRVLDRPTTAGDRHITKVKPLPSSPDHTFNLFQLRKSRRKPIEYSDQPKTCLPKNHPIYTVIDEKQPYMFDKPMVIDYYGSLNYWDWKYPRQPIDVRFAADPKKFCKMNPNSYPCYLINSRKDLK